MAIILTIITAFMWLGTILALSLKTDWADGLAAVLIAISAMIGLVTLVYVTGLAWGGRL